MKRLFFNAFFLISVVCFGQNNVTTTTEEYNYFTETYPKSEVVKEGYNLEPMFDKTFEDFRFQYWFINNSSTNKSIGLLIKVTKNGKKTRYLCMPFNNGELMVRYANDKSNLGVTMSVYYDIVNGMMFSNLVQSKKNN